MKINCCNKICDECAFNGNTENTLYAETYNIINNFILFPCHKYLKSKTGCEYLGAETLNEIKVCRGYVSFMKKYHINDLKSIDVNSQLIWIDLFNEIRDYELKDILDLKTLESKHIALRDKIYIGN